MLKKLTSVLFAAVCGLSTLLAGAQTTAPAAAHHVCGTEVVQERYLAQHPEARAAQHALYQRLATMGAAQQRSTTAAADVTIPVVVHVIHADGADNISDAQIASAIELLNIDYQKQNADTASTSPLFQPLAAAVGFRFRLARLDPSGGCTTGITRHYAPGLVVDDFSGRLQNLVSWDTQRYLNIWVVNAIVVPGLSGTIGGYSPLPQMAAGPMDGLVVRHDYFGNLGTSSPANALRRVATHEIGHHFGLLHTWGSSYVSSGNCTDTDYVADTPPTDGSTTCNLTYAPCGPVTNVQNYMDYSGCSTMFTQGQRTLMRNVLQTIRTQVATPANLLATGTNDGYVAPACPPVAQFYPSQTVLCENAAVTFHDQSYNVAPGTALTYSWSFPGGTPATSTAAAPTVTYPTAGFYDVSLTVSNALGSSAPTTFSQLIQVSGASSGEVAPLAESFEPYTTFPNYYPAPTQRNYATRFESATNQAPGNGWVRRQASATVAAADGSAYLWVPNRALTGGFGTATSTLITPNIDLRALNNPVLSFSEFYGAASAAANVALTVAVSLDCGTTWTDVATYDNAQLNLTGTAYSRNAAPATPADWRRLQLPIAPAYRQSPHFKVRFTATHDAAVADNPLYFDKLNICEVLSTQAALAQRSIRVFPNPLTAATAVQFDLPTSAQVQVSLTDLLGREVLRLPGRRYPAGASVLPLGAAASTLRPGLYVLRLSLDSETYSTKLTVE
ncbi:M43 family zinc metalloprotease [Hymenobacter sp. ASUV-10]|uniref:M43 family zinc metalloprotease n=1 Tax=Hymenobacter aranciens TaxID=3063996 RepID=A0ABT9BFS1_9BACT|nr:M43 family zinc metalloprotease [Hymenobacter sp. ASUV-10]MDO7877116.1 M43 family zinc metalloprotease [Hymenobacter sp. ASUV-10]